MPAAARKPAAPKRRLSGAELVERLNAMIVQLIAENRRLKRQVDRLAQRGSGVASKKIDRGLRGIQRRVERALTTKRTKRRPVKSSPRRKRKPGQPAA